jgi:hypothetical protein
MAKDSDRLAGTPRTENTGGVLSGLLAEENALDRRALWRLGSWAAAAVGAIIVASLANQSSLGSRHDQLAAADLTRQAQQLQSLAREGQNETRRLASAVDTLNGDRDRLYSRVTVLEQGLDQVTGAVARQNSAQGAAAGPQVAAKSAVTPSPTPAVEPAPAAQAQTASPPTVGPVSTTAAFVPERPRAEIPVAAQSQPAQPQPQAQPQPKPQSQPQAQAATPAAALLPKVVSNVPTEPLTGPKSLLMGPPDPAASKLIEPAKMASAAAPAEKNATPLTDKNAAAPAEKNPAPLTEKNAAPPTEKTAAPASEKEVAAITPAPAKEAEAADGASSKVQHTEFAIDLGSANSVGGLRALWRGLAKVNAELASLHPIIVVKERSSGLGMQLRLAAGPLSDAAAAAKICAALIESERGCETTVFDGQRLSMQAEETPQPTTTPPSAKTTQSRHGTQRRSRREEPVPVPANPETSSTFSSLFGRGK